MELLNIERSIIKKYRKEIWSKFIKAIKNYELILDNDKIAVCISGGKDSFLMAKCFQELKKHGKQNFDIKFIVMNPGYTDENLNKIINNAKHLNIDIDIFDTNIFDVTNSLKEGNPCYLCARMRRGFLYSKAKELGCNKIALGHHFDDVIETILLNLFYGSQFKTMMPKVHSENFEGMELIRPLYYIKEQDIISWSKYNELSFLNCACKFTAENYSKIETNSKRKEIKNLINSLRINNPLIDQSIFKSSENVNINSIISYFDDNGEYNFLDKY